MSLFSRCVLVLATVAAAAGTVFGFVRGMSYLPTLPVAVVEGAVLIGVPGTVVGVVLAGVITLVARLRRAYARPELRENGYTLRP